MMIQCKRCGQSYDSNKKIVRDRNDCDDCCYIYMFFGAELSIRATRDRSDNPQYIFNNRLSIDANIRKWYKIGRKSKRNRKGLL